MSAQTRLHRRLTQLAWTWSSSATGVRYRTHLASRAAPQTLQLASQRPVPIAQLRIVAIVKQVLQVVPLRAFVGTTNSDDIDRLGEGEAAALFDLIAPPARLAISLDAPSTVGDIEASLRTAFGRGVP